MFRPYDGVTFSYDFGRGLPLVAQAFARSGEDWKDEGIEGRSSISRTADQVLLPTAR